MSEIKLEATTAKKARSEIAAKFPQGANYKGYDEDGECVLMSLVRPRGEKANVATVTRNRSKRPVRFTCEPLASKIKTTHERLTIVHDGYYNTSVMLDGNYILRDKSIKAVFLNEAGVETLIRRTK